MDRMLYVAMSAAVQNMRGQAIATHNLANASTGGFKADLAQARAMPVYGDGHPSRVFAMTERPGIDFSYGSIATTENTLDLAIDGDGWLVVQGLDGQEAYTRAGALRMNNFGLLETMGGLPLMGDAGPITLPASEEIVIGSDGTVSVKPLGQEANTLAVVDRVRLVNPPASDLVKGDDGLFRMRDGSVAEPDVTVKVVQGALEESNVSTIKQMLDVVTLARQYEMSIKAMKVAEEMDAASSQMMRMNA